MNLDAIHIATRRRLALRAEAAAFLLRLVAYALDHARPGAQREAGILHGTRDVCAGALDALAIEISKLVPSQHEHFVRDRAWARQQRFEINTSQTLHAKWCAERAEAWEAWAGQVDP